MTRSNCAGAAVSRIDRTASSFTRNLPAPISPPDFLLKSDFQTGWRGRDYHENMTSFRCRCRPGQRRTSWKSSIAVRSRKSRDQPRHGNAFVLWPGTDGKGSCLIVRRATLQQRIELCGEPACADDDAVRVRGPV